MTVANEDQRPHDYGEMDYYPRPSHADFTYLQKYGIKASSGGGRSSARETIGAYRSSWLMYTPASNQHGMNRSCCSSRRCREVPKDDT